MTRTRKLALGLLVAFGVLTVVELGHHLALGPPPTPFHVARVSGTALVDEGEAMRLAHAVDPAMDVRVDKAHARPRIVTLGGSSVRNPGPPENNWPHPLQQAHPELDVVNLASPGQTMSGLANLVQQIEPLRPDLIIVYSGHNDLSQVVFSGSVSAHRGWRLQVWKVLGMSWLAWYLTPEGNAELMDPNRRAGLMFATDDAALNAHDTLIDRYEADLRLLLEEAPAPVLLTTLVRNFDQSPQGLLTTDPACREVASTVPTTQPDRPAERSRELHAACGDTALGAWLDAHAATDPEQALAPWYASLRMDPFPLRATPEVDDTLRRVAQETGTPLVDLEVELGRFGRNASFIDTLHPSRQGARHIAEALGDDVRRLTSAPAGSPPAGR